MAPLGSATAVPARGPDADLAHRLAEGRAWLEAHGAEFGLCRVYENEPWHFEPLIERGGTCPVLRPDGSVDAG